MAGRKIVSQPSGTTTMPVSSSADEISPFEQDMELAQFFIDRREKRIQIGWRVPFGIWAVIIAATAYVKNHDIVLLIGICVVCIAFHWAWEMIHFSKARSDGDLANLFRRRAQRRLVLSAEDQKIVDERDKPPANRWWNHSVVRFNVSATGALCVGLVAWTLSDSQTATKDQVRFSAHVSRDGAILRLDGVSGEMISCIAAKCAPVVVEPNSARNRAPAQSPAAAPVPALVESRQP